MARQLTSVEHSALRANIDRFDAYVRKHYSNASGWVSYPSSDVDAIAKAAGCNKAPTNEDRGAVECFEFVADPPESYFGYVSFSGRTIGGKAEPDDRAGCGCDVTTWMGDIIGRGSVGPVWRDNFGGKRRHVSFMGINGYRYSGTYFASSGNYCRVRRCKTA